MVVKNEIRTFEGHTKNPRAPTAARWTDIMNPTTTWKFKIRGFKIKNKWVKNTKFSVSWEVRVSGLRSQV